MTLPTTTAASVETARAIRAVDALPIEWQPLAFDLLFADTALGEAYGYRGPHDVDRVRELVLARTA